MITHVKPIRPGPRAFVILYEIARDRESFQVSERQSCGHSCGHSRRHIDTRSQGRRGGREAVISSEKNPIRREGEPDGSGKR